MNAPLRLRARNPLDAVHATLVFQEAKDFLARHLEDDFFEASDLRRTRLDRFRLPATLFGVALIHAVKVSREERGLVSARPGAYLDNGVAVLGRVVRQQRILDPALEFGDELLERGDFLRRHLRHLDVASLGEFQIIREIDAGLGERFPVVEEVLEPVILARQLAGGAGIVKKAVLRHIRLQFRESETFSLDELGVVHGHGGVGFRVGRKKTNKKR